MYIGPMKNRQLVLVQRQWRKNDASDKCHNLRLEEAFSRMLTPEMTMKVVARAVRDHSPRMMPPDGAPPLPITASIFHTSPLPINLPHNLPQMDPKSMVPEPCLSLCYPPWIMPAFGRACPPRMVSLSVVCCRLCAGVMFTLIRDVNAGVSCNRMFSMICWDRRKWWRGESIIYRCCWLTVIVGW